MKALTILILSAVAASAATVKISDLPLKATTSTNTFIEVADMNAATKSGKYLLTNLATQAALDLKAPIASPTFTGTVTAPALNVTGEISADSLGLTGLLPGWVKLDANTNLVNVSAGEAAALSQLVTNTFTGTGTIPLSSVTDAKAPLNAPAFTGLATTSGNLGPLLSVGDTTYVDVTKASQTNAVSGALNLGWATNGVAGAEYTHVRWLFNGSGSDQTLTIQSLWRTNVYSAVPPALTNGTITKMILTCGGATPNAAAQTNCYVSFEYYK